MASNPPAACCVAGFKHEGTATGEMKKIDNIDTYFASPTDGKTGQAVVIVSDVFGIYPNVQFVADDFAANGWLTVIPDLFHGNPVTFDEFNSGKDLRARLAEHLPNIDPIIEKTVKHLRETLGIKKIGGVGYCFGAKYVVRFLKDGKLDAGYIAHPSFVTPEELEAITRPLSIAAAETDSIFSAPLRHKSEAILAKTGMPYQINLFSSVQHGFALRADLSVPNIKFAKEQAFVQAVAWFGHHL